MPFPFPSGLPPRPACQPAGGSSATHDRRSADNLMLLIAAIALFVIAGF